MVGEELARLDDGRGEARRVDRIGASARRPLKPDASRMVARQSSQGDQTTRGRFELVAPARQVGMIVRA